MNIESKIWNTTFINILVVNFCHQMGQQMMNTLVPKYANALGANAYTVGLLSSVFAISSLLIRPVSTPAFDSFSKKKLLIDQFRYFYSIYDMACQKRLYVNGSRLFMEFVLVV